MILEGLRITYIACGIFDSETDWQTDRQILDRCRAKWSLLVTVLSAGDIRPPSFNKFLI